MQPTLFSNGACRACLRVSVEALAAAESWSSPDAAKARQGLEILFIYCDGMEESRVELVSFNRWLQRHQDYAVFLQDAYLRALDQQSMCPHRLFTSVQATEVMWSVMPHGTPHPAWERYLNETSNIPVCLDCLAVDENIDGFLDSESDRITDKARQIIAAFIDHFLGNASEGTVLGARIPGDAYIRWVYGQDLTEPWYAYSVTGRYIFRFMRSCADLDGFTTETLEAFEN